MSGSVLRQSGTALSVVARVFLRPIGAQLGSEKDRWKLWVPVGLGVGVAAYFGLTHEPAVWLSPAAGLMAFLVALLGRRRATVLAPACAALLIAGGLTLAQWHTYDVAAPKLTKRLNFATVEGRVVEAWATTKGQRLLLADLSIERLEPDQLPKYVRVTTRQSGAAEVGQRVQLRASLRPPSRPALPGSFDFERKAYFEQIGGYGFSLGSIVVTIPAETGIWSNFRVRLNRFRQIIGARIRNGSSPASGAIAQALMTGDRASISQADLKVMRDSGLAHLLAISGLHVGLMAATLFFVIRALFALSPHLALHYPIKKFAALGAMIGALGYLALTGATIPTQRAFVMTCLVLFAVILDRRVISMALAAWAALVVLITSPESLLGPSFQLSFAAVIALIAAYEALRERFALWRAHANAVRRLSIYVVSVGLTTIVAGLATAPFAIYHFNRFAIFSLAANLVAVPVMAIWVMPCAMLAYLLMPVGLEGLALAPMGWGISAILWVARGVASLPGSVVLIPSLTIWGLALVALGGLWLCLWRGTWRLLGVPLIVAGLASPFLDPGPDILIDGGGRLFAIRDSDGTLRLSSQRIARFTAEQWLRRSAQETAGAWADADGTSETGLACDLVGCVYRAKGHIAALVRDPRALADDCQLATLVVSTVPVRNRCRSAQVVIDRFDLWRRGGHAIWLSEGHPAKVKSVASVSGQRPWTTARAKRIRKPSE